MEVASIREFEVDHSRHLRSKAGHKAGKESNQETEIGKDAGYWVG
jgi:hypothetical protein